MKTQDQLQVKSREGYNKYKYNYNLSLTLIFKHYH